MPTKSLSSDLGLFRPARGSRGPRPPAPVPDADVAEYLAYLERLRVARDTGRLPPDVGRWAVRELSESMSVTTRQMARNRLLQEAARRLSGSTWAKARRLQGEILALRGERPRHRRAPGHVIDTAITRAIRDALHLDPGAPTSLDQLVRILQGR